ncbi:MAG: replication-relaxation family protein [Candidatus Aureabacteria bacterium]|nr:replication-relaxation family protein [Candidatus Auribacterota bacterium]
MRIQERDKEILEDICKFQCLTSYQIAKLYEMNLKVCQRRLRKLCKNDYLRKLPIPSIKSGRSPYLYYLGEKGASLLNISISKPRLTLQLSHQIKNTEIVIDIKCSFKNTNIQCDILPEHLIRKAQLELIPDCALKISKNNKNALFMLEICMGTEIAKSPSCHEDVDSKICRYTDFFDQNDMQCYENYFGCNFKRFRLLFIANSYQRLAGISRIISEHDSYGFILISTLKELKAKGISGKIWHVPALEQSHISII